MKKQDKPSKLRLDQALVQKQHFESREKAQRAILAGDIRVNDQVILKAHQPVDLNAEFKIKQYPRFVSRGGEKLLGLFQQFPLTVKGKVAVDLGASTGGFTDCLLQHGVKKVYAVDVGYGQLDYKLRENAQVIVMEKINARHLTHKDFPEPITFLCADLSFISLKKVLPAIESILQPQSEAVLLIKPQFEAKRQEIQKGGVVKDLEIQKRVTQEVSEEAKKLGLHKIEQIPSPLKGPAGNQEYLIWLRKD